MKQSYPAEVFPPGDTILEQLQARDWTQSDLAVIIGRSDKVVNDLIKGRKSIDPKIAMALAAAFGTSPDLWLNLESTYRLGQTQLKVDDIAHRAQIYSKAPVKEMIRRHWIEDSRNPEVLENNVRSYLGIESLKDDPMILPHAARKSSPYDEVSPAQTVWLIRARQLAERLVAKPFASGRFRKSLDNLRPLLRHPEEIRMVPNVLAEGGVRLVVVESLKGAKLDGACFWIDPKSPVVALSMRYDRIDYFWHTLMHELGHIHHGDGFSVDKDVMPREEHSDRPENERQADAFAVSKLVSQENLDDFILRVGPLYSKQRLLGFANVEQVHPGIVLGQLHYRGEIAYSQNRPLLAKVRSIITTSALTDGFGTMLPAFV
ncbi:MAG: helix-turn-helix domain-containing protein [Chloroflexi bacterium]|nr:helix-turn-helix domain-containing protein [Chloroflexota bacterium]